MDLAREILRQVEATADPQPDLEVKVQGYSPKEINYHVWLLHDAGLIEAMDFSSADDFDWRPVRLTWAGQEFLNTARDNTRWNKAKDAVLSTTGGLTFDLLKAWLKQEAAQRLGIMLQ